MTPIRSTLAALPLLLCTLLVGCGKNLAIPDTPTTDNWYFSGYYQVISNIIPFSFGGSLINTGGQLSGVFHIDTPCFGNGATDIPYTGTLTTNNNLSITSSPVNGQTLTLQGKLSNNNSTLSNGYFTITGGCTGNLVSLTGSNGPGASFTPTGKRLPSLTASWPPVPNPTLNLTEQLTQSPTPDTHGDFALTGTVNVTGSACFTTGTLQPTSFVSGLLGQQAILMNDGSTLTAMLQVQPQIGSIKPVLSLYPGTITGGNCNGPVDISLQP